MVFDYTVIHIEPETNTILIDWVTASRSLNAIETVEEIFDRRLIDPVVFMGHLEPV